MLALRRLTKAASLNWYQAAFFGTIKKTNLPDLGEKIKEATVKKWHVKVGDKVEEFQPLCDVATDKLFTQIPSNFNGKVHKTFHKEEDICQVGELFIEIEVEDGGASAPAAAAAPAKEAPKAAEPQKAKEAAPKKEKDVTESNDEIQAAPAVRSLAREHNIDLKKVKGTGKGGRVSKEDVMAFISGGQKETSKPSKAPAAPKSDKIVKEFTKTTLKMTDFQKGMQKSMTEAHKIPTLYLKDEFDLTELDKTRNTFKKMNYKITFMSIFIKAFSLAMKNFPIVNSYYDETKPFEYTQIENHNISVAIDSPKGLVVPNIKNVQNLSLLEVQEELNKLKKLADSGTLGPKELFEGTATISNIGTVGGTYTAPIMFPPQVTIVGLGKVQTLPRYVGNDIKPRKIMCASFGTDHRVIDGATITRFCNAWREYLENPESIILHLK